MRGSRSATTPPRAPGHRALVIGCGALAHELVALTRRAGFPEVDLTCLPATLHNRPEQIPAAVRARIHRARAAGRDRIFVAYADCGTGGLLDRVLEEEGVARLEGAHCYEVYAGRAAFANLADEEPGTFYLTDFLARNFDRLVIRGLGLDRHPELLPLYFGNYTRVLFLAQTEDAELTARARRGARHLGLTFERRFTGYGELGSAMIAIAVVGMPAAGDASHAPQTRIPEPLPPPAPATHGTATIGQRIQRDGGSRTEKGRPMSAQAGLAQETAPTSHGSAREPEPATAPTAADSATLGHDSQSSSSAWRVCRVRVTSTSMTRGHGPSMQGESAAPNGPQALTFGPATEESMTARHARPAGQRRGAA